MVVWAQVNNISAVYMEGDIIYENLEDDSIMIEEDAIVCEMKIGTRGGNPNGADIFQFIVCPLNKAYKVGVTDGRSIYFVEELTVGSLKQTIREIEKKANNTWGRDYDEVLMKLSWIAESEWDFMYEAKEPVLNPDGTINYDPRAYMGNSFMAQGIEAARKGLN